MITGVKQHEDRILRLALLVTLRRCDIDGPLAESARVNGLCDPSGSGLLVSEADRQDSEEQPDTKGSRYPTRGYCPSALTHVASI
jgi:hypothetical protein